MIVQRRRRAIVALAMLLATNVAMFEPVNGEVRDAAEHYGGGQVTGLVANAADVGATETGQRPDSRHIKGFDHCTHAHDLSVRSSCVLLVAEDGVAAPARPVVEALPLDAPPARLYHPPKA